MRSRSGENHWAVTCYFNPGNYRSRLDNFRAFRRELGVPLVAAELSMNGSFHLDRHDADILVPLRDGDVLWQKERLLNIATARLPGECEFVSWIDSDVHFLDPDWASQVPPALDRSSLVQLYRECVYLGPGEDPEQAVAGGGKTREESFSSLLRAGRKSKDMLNVSWNQQAPKPYHRLIGMGKGWAMRREVLARHGLYDACIIGGGDRAVLCAAVGEFDRAVDYLRMNRPRRDHYLRWAQPFYDDVGGRLDCIEGKIVHLWHGDMGDRMYYRRHGALAEHDFDPFTDIIADSDGCWKWNSPKSELHAYCRQFFVNRFEDGRHQGEDQPQ